MDHQVIIETYGNGTAKAFLRDAMMVTPEIEGYEPFFVNTVLDRRPHPKIITYRRVENGVAA